MRSSLVRLAPSPGVATYFNTLFPATENPISQGAIWVNGALDGGSWNNVRTTPAEAFGAAQVSSFDDCVAHLKTSYRTFTGNQYGRATVFRSVAYSPGVSHEIELLLRFSISSGDAHGYEVLWGVTGELNTVRWNGGLGDYTPIGTGGGTGVDIGAAVDGDVLEARISGNIITVYKNTVLKLTSDITAIGGTVYNTGQPGIGFWPTTGSTPGNYGWKNYTADDL